MANSPDEANGPKKLKNLGGMLIPISNDALVDETSTKIFNAVTKQLGNDSIVHNECVNNIMENLAASMGSYLDQSYNRNSKLKETCNFLDKNMFNHLKKYDVFTKIMNILLLNRNVDKDGLYFTIPITKSPTSNDRSSENLYIETCIDIRSNMSNESYSFNVFYKRFDANDPLGPSEKTVYVTEFNIAVEKSGRVIPAMIMKNDVDFEDGVYMYNKYGKHVEVTISSLESLIQELANLGLAKKLS